MEIGRSLCLVLAAVTVAGCATPEVAETYEERSLVPQEIAAGLRSEDPTQRAAAAKQIETMEPAQSRSVLMELTGHELVPVRMLAVSALGKHHASDGGVVTRLAEVLSLDGDADVRSRVVDALSRSGSVNGLAAILDALGNDSSLLVRREAALALDKLTGQSHALRFVTTFDDAEMQADETTMTYEEWFEANRAALRWDAGTSRFVVGRQEGSP
jgi:HEAT repeat protein